VRSSVSHRQKQMSLTVVQAARFLTLAVLLTSAAIVVCEDDPALSEDPEPDFTDPALSEDPVATDAHPDIEPAWIFPDCPDGKVPVGGSTDLVVALANIGSKMFNVSHVTGKLTTASGKTARELKLYEYGQQLGPREQRSFRYPLPIDAETPLGEYTFVAQAFYNTKDKQPYVSVVYNETIELVPPLPDKDAQMLRAIQVGAGGGLVVLLALSAARLMLSGGSSAGKPSKKAASKESAAAATDANEWIKNLPAVRVSEDKQRKPKKA